MSQPKYGFVFATVKYPEGDAASERAAMIVKMLRASGHIAYLVVPHSAIKKKQIVSHEHLKEKKIVPYLVLLSDYMRTKFAAFQFFQTIAFIIKAAGLIVYRSRQKKLNYVILYSPDTLEYLLVILACKIRGVTLILEACERMTLYYKDERKNVLRKAGSWLTENLTPKVSEGIIVISTLLQKYYSERNPHIPILLLPILVDSSKPDQTLSDRVNPSEIRVLYSGTFGEKDGVQYILKGFCLFNKIYSSSRLILTGKPVHADQFASIQSLIEKQDCSAAIEYRGFVSRKELAVLQDSSSMLLVCRTKSDFAKYGFPWKLGEYCLTGKPIIATRVGDIDLYFQAEIDIVFAESEDSESIGKKMLFIAENYDKALLIAKKSKESCIKFFDYTNHCEAMDRFIHTCIKEQ
ncbi:glycosyltransferase [bacterium]|nr:glycosyltransferase [bacterium]NUN46085.1 glycosyltransferase [bacterium]